MRAATPSPQTRRLLRTITMRTRMMSSLKSWKSPLRPGAPSSPTGPHAVRALRDIVLELIVSVLRLARLNFLRLRLHQVGGVYWRVLAVEVIVASLLGAVIREIIVEREREAQTQPQNSSSRAAAAGHEPPMARAPSSLLLQGLVGRCLLGVSGSPAAAVPGHAAEGDDSSTPASPRRLFAAYTASVARVGREAAQCKAGGLRSRATACGVHVSQDLLASYREIARASRAASAAYFGRPSMLMSTSM